MRDLDAQTFGSVFVIAAFASAEAAAQMLTCFPNSAWLWYLNLEVFIEFEHARIASSPIRYLFGPSSLLCWCLLLSASLIARRYKSQFGTAAIANLCFACVVGLVLPYSNSAAFVVSAEPQAFTVTNNLSNLLMLTTFMSAFGAFAISHISFLRRICVGEVPPGHHHEYAATSVCPS